LLAISGENLRTAPVSHLTATPGRDAFTTTRTSRVGLDELPDGAAIRGFHRGRTDRLVMGFLRQTSRIARVSTNASIPYLPYSRPTPEYLNPPQGACGSSVMLLITTRPALS